MSQGTVIQVFGRFFAGKMNMNMERWYQVYPDYAREPFKIIDVSPFSIIGKPDPILQKYIECERTNTRVKADIRKNFDSICKKAYCDWFVIDNSSALMELTQINNQFYSLIDGENTDFIDDYYNNSADAKNNRIKPALEGFSERFKRQYDMFIDNVLKNYDPERIILIRSHVPKFCLDNGEIVKTNHTEEGRMLLEKLDNYFWNRVGCHVLNTPARFFETKKHEENQLFDDIYEILRIDLEREVIAEIQNSIVKREFSVNSGNHLECHEYIYDGFDDIVELFWLYNQSEDRVAFKAKTQAILSNKNGAAYVYTKQLFERNINLLRRYDYCCINLDNIQFEDKIIVRIDAKHFIEIKKNDFCLFNTIADEKWDYNEFIENNYTCGINHIEDALESWETYFERGRRKCTDPFVLCFDSKEEFEHSLYFVDYEDILYNEHYAVTIKDSESGIFHFEEYRSKVDAAFLFDENTRLSTCLRGLSDQSWFYTRLKYECDQYGLNLYLCDLNFDRGAASFFMGFQLDRLAGEHINGNRFSTIFSPKLRLRIVNTTKYYAQTHMLFILNSLGLHELTLAVNGKNMLADVFPVEALVENGIDYMYCPKTYKDVVRNQIGLTFFNLFLHDPDYKHKQIFEQYLGFPVLDCSDYKNQQLFNKMSTVDSVVIHIRLGDHIGGYFGEESLKLFPYKAALERVYSEEFGQYKNKHLIVVSEDTEFCKQHRDELGLDIAGDEITFVDWNHHYNSFRDMQIISMGKIVIKHLGFFALLATLISTTVEYVLHASTKGLFIKYKREKGAVSE